MEKRIIAIGLSLILLVGVLIGAYTFATMNNTTTVKDRAQALGSSGNPYTILEVVPDHAYAEIGYLIGGQEPVLLNSLVPNFSLSMSEVQTVLNAVNNAVYVKSKKIAPFNVVKEENFVNSLSESAQNAKIETMEDGSYQVIGGYYKKVGTNQGEWEANYGTGTITAYFAKSWENNPSETYNYVYLDDIGYAMIDPDHLTTYYRQARDDSDNIIYISYDEDVEHGVVTSAYNYEYKTFIYNNENVYVLLNKISSDTYRKVDDAREIESFTYKGENKGSWEFHQAFTSKRYIFETDSFSWIFDGNNQSDDAIFYTTIKNTRYDLGTNTCLSASAICSIGAEQVVEFSFNNNEIFKKEVLGLSGNSINTYNVSVVVKTPQELTLADVDSADLIYFNNGGGKDSFRYKNIVNLYKIANDIPATWVPEQTSLASEDESFYTNTLNAVISRIYSRVAFGENTVTYATDGNVNVTETKKPVVIFDTDIYKDATALEEVTHYGEISKYTLDATSNNHDKLVAVMGTEGGAGTVEVHETVFKTFNQTTWFGINDGNLNGTNRFEKIEVFKRGDINDVPVDAYIISDTGSEYPIYGWLDNTTFYWASEAEVAYFSADSRYFMHPASGRNNTIKYVDLTGISTAKVMNMSGFFDECTVLSTIIGEFDAAGIVDGFATATGSADQKYTGFHRMFTRVKITNTDTITFKNTDTVLNMGYMFWRCTTIENWDIPTLDTSNCVNLTYFLSTYDNNPGSGLSKDSQLKTVNLSNMDTSKCKNYTNMFNNDKKLETIYATDSFVIISGANTSSMFGGCSNKLKGGAGTVWNSSKVNGDFAIIDGGESNPGYFTQGTITVIDTPVNPGTTPVIDPTWTEVPFYKNSIVKLYVILNEMYPATYFKHYVEPYLGNSNTIDLTYVNPINAYLSGTRINQNARKIEGINYELLWPADIYGGYGAENIYKLMGIDNPSLTADYVAEHKVLSFSGDSNDTVISFLMNDVIPKSDTTSEPFEVLNYDEDNRLSGIEALKYLMYNQVKNTVDKSRISILEIQPSNYFITSKAWSWKINGILPYYLGSLKEFSNQTSQMASKQFIGVNVDINNDYELIYLGADTHGLVTKPVNRILVKQDYSIILTEGETRTFSAEDILSIEPKLGARIVDKTEILSPDNMARYSASGGILTVKGENHGNDTIKVTITANFTGDPIEDEVTIPVYVQSSTNNKLKFERSTTYDQYPEYEEDELEEESDDMLTDGKLSPGYYTIKGGPSKNQYIYYDYSWLWGEGLGLSSTLPMDSDGYPQSNYIWYYDGTKLQNQYSGRYLIIGNNSLYYDTYQQFNTYVVKNSSDYWNLYYMPTTWGTTCGLNEHTHSSKPTQDPKDNIYTYYNCGTNGNGGWRVRQVPVYTWGLDCNLPHQHSAKPSYTPTAENIHDGCWRSQQSSTKYEWYNTCTTLEHHHTDECYPKFYLSIDSAFSFFYSLYPYSTSTLSNKCDFIIEKAIIDETIYYKPTLTITKDFYSSDIINGYKENNKKVSGTVINYKDYMDIVNISDEVISVELIEGNANYVFDTENNRLIVKSKYSPNTCKFKFTIQYNMEGVSRVQTSHMYLVVKEIRDINHEKVDTYQTQYNDETMNGMVYTHTGDSYEIINLANKNDWQIYIDGALHKDGTSDLNNDRLSTVSYTGSDEEHPKLADDKTYTAVQTRFSGNDITQKKMNDLESYLDANLPIIVSDKLVIKNNGRITGVNEYIVDNSSYLYEFLSTNKSRLMYESQLNSTLWAEAYSKIINIDPISIPNIYDQSDNGGVLTDSDYLASRMLEFQIKLTTSSRTAVGDYEVKLYIDGNCDGIFVDAEELKNISVRSSGGIVNSSSLQANTNEIYTISRAIPEEYYGVIVWKLEVMDTMDNSIRKSITGISSLHTALEDRQDIMVLQLKPKWYMNNGINLDLDTTKAKYDNVVSYEQKFSQYMENLNEFKINVVSLKDADLLQGNSVKPYFAYKVTTRIFGSETLSETSEVKAKLYPSEEKLLTIVSETTGKAANTVTEKPIFYEPGTSIMRVEEAALQGYNLDDYLGNYHIKEVYGTANGETKTYYVYQFIQGLGFENIFDIDNGEDHKNISEIDEVVGIDMLILGFSDASYYTNNDNLINAINNHAMNGKTILMTHDIMSYHSMPASSGTERDKNAYKFVKAFKGLMSIDRYSHDTAWAPGSNRAVAYDYAEQGWADTAMIISYQKTAGVNLSYIPYYKSPKADKDDKVLNASLATMTDSTSYNDANNRSIGMFKQCEIVNRGQITEYPYYIKDTFSASGTHHQYWQLDLEDDVAVWATLKSISPGYENYNRDTRNHYYIYSKGNLVYTGMGHSESITDDEIKLFINTIVSSYKNNSIGTQLVITDLNATILGNDTYIYIDSDYDPEEFDDIDTSEMEDVKIKFNIIDNNLITNSKITIDLANINEGIDVDMINAKTFDEYTTVVLTTDYGSGSSNDRIKIYEYQDDISNATLVEMKEGKLLVRPENNFYMEIPEDIVLWAVEQAKNSEGSSFILYARMTLTYNTRLDSEEDELDESYTKKVQTLQRIIFVKRSMFMLD